MRFKQPMPEFRATILRQEKLTSHSPKFPLEELY